MEPPMSQSEKFERMELTDLARETQKLSVEELKKRHGDHFLLFQAGPGHDAGVAETRAVELGATASAAFQGFDVVILGPPGPGGPDRMIGRLPEGALEINDANVSGQHAVLKPLEAGWGISDLASRNGTYVNDDPVPMAEDGNPLVLKAGDRITLGRFGCSYLDAERLMMMVAQIPVSDG
jgi:hypothetical protein